MRFCARWTIFCGRAQKCLCREADFIWYTARSLAEIMSKMVEYKIEPKRMRLVYPYIDKEPNMVLIEGLRGGKSRVTVEKPLIVYKEQGVYTDEIYDIYGY